MRCTFISHRRLQVVHEHLLHRRRGKSRTQGNRRDAGIGDDDGLRGGGWVVDKDLLDGRQVEATERDVEGPEAREGDALGHAEGGAPGSGVLSQRIEDLG